MTRQEINNIIKQNIKDKESVKNSITPTILSNVLSGICDFAETISGITEDLFGILNTDISDLSGNTMIIESGLTSLSGKTSTIDSNLKSLSGTVLTKYITSANTYNALEEKVDQTDMASALYAGKVKCWEIWKDNEYKVENLSDGEDGGQPYFPPQIMPDTSYAENYYGVEGDYKTHNGFIEMGYGVTAVTIYSQELESKGYSDGLSVSKENIAELNDNNIYPSFDMMSGNIIRIYYLNQTEVKLTF